jgi:hypothetical protein
MLSFLSCLPVWKTNFGSIFLSGFGCYGVAVYEYNSRGKIPYLPVIQAPYYQWIGKRRDYTSTWFALQFQELGLKDGLGLLCVYLSGWCCVC